MSNLREKIEAIFEERFTEDMTDRQAIDAILAAISSEPAAVPRHNSVLVPSSKLLEMKAELSDLQSQLATQQADFAALSALYEVACSERGALRKDAERHARLMTAICRGLVSTATEVSSDGAAKIELRYKDNFYMTEAEKVLDCDIDAAISAQSGERKEGDE